MMSCLILDRPTSAAASTCGVALSMLHVAVPWKVLPLLTSGLSIAVQRSSQLDILLEGGIVRCFWALKVAPTPVVSPQAVSEVSNTAARTSRSVPLTAVDLTHRRITMVIENMALQRLEMIGGETAEEHA